MEFLVKSFEAKKDHHLADELVFSKEQILRTIGRDFNKSVANIVGLVSMLEDGVSDQDFEIIRSYLSKEATNLHVMVKGICS